MAQCTATSRSTGERCKRQAVPGKKVCKYHGGLSPGAPKGNKHALKTGICEAITRDVMTEEEKAFADSVDINPIEAMKEQIRILKVKELRILSRMKNVLDEEASASSIGPDGKKKDSFVPLTLNVIKTKNFAGQESSTLSRNSETHELFYLRLEQAHNTVLAQLRRALSQLAKMQVEAGETDRPLPLYTLPPEEEEATDKAPAKKKGRKKGKKDG